MIKMANPNMKLVRRYAILTGSSRFSFKEAFDFTFLKRENTANAVFGRLAETVAFCRGVLSLFGKS